MVLFDLFKRRDGHPLDKRLFGQWELVRSQQVITSDRAVSEFTPDGRLIYSITENGKTGIMNMVYRVENGVLITDQPSHPSEERTKYSFDDDGLLVLDYDGQKTWFRQLL